jgi:hypothetical protein
MTRALLTLALTVLACESSPELTGEHSQKPPAASPPPATAAPAPGYKRYGEAITLPRAEPLSTVLTSPAQYKDKPVLVEGNVRRACSRKGCWMEIASSGDPSAQACRVTFKDYGFFVPTDSAGAQARVQGNVVVERVDRAHVEHLESEGARFANKNADGTADEVRFVATAVELRK